MGYVFFKYHIQKKTFQYQVTISMAATFTIDMIQSIRKRVGYKNTYNSYLIIFYDHINTDMFKVIGTVLYLLFED